MILLSDARGHSDVGMNVYLDIHMTLPSKDRF